MRKFSYTKFLHYGISFLLHRFKSYRGNYSREETICGNTVYFLCIIEPSANNSSGSVVVNIIRQSIGKIFAERQKICYIVMHLNTGRQTNDLD